MYDELFARLATEDVHRCYAGVTLPNDASIALHERSGFREVAILQRGRQEVRPLLGRRVARTLGVNCSRAEPRCVDELESTPGGQPVGGFGPAARERVVQGEQAGFVRSTAAERGEERRAPWANRVRSRGRRR